MLSIMRADPYARLLSLVDHYHRDKTSFTPQQEALIDTLRGDLPGLMDARARRLSDEASSLPPVSYLFRDAPPFRPLTHDALAFRRTFWC